jgi:hypothetical protein
MNLWQLCTVGILGLSAAQAEDLRIGIIGWAVVGCLVYLGVRLAFPVRKTSRTGAT